MNVQNFLKSYHKPVFSVHPDDTLAETARRFDTEIEGRRYSLAVVCDSEENVVGVLSLGDIARAVGKYEAVAPTLPVRSIMKTSPAVCHLKDQIEDVLKTMCSHAVRHMPVVEDGKLVGLVARRDALEFLHDEAALNLDQLTQYVFRSGARY
jgi:CBS domain-containing protein